MTNSRNRKNRIVTISLPPEEHEAFKDFCALIRQPLSWALRDAMRIYMAAMQTRPEGIAKLQALDVAKMAGATPRHRRSNLSFRDNKKRRPASVK